ncbi:MAG TPA: hypothetical protein DEV93_16265, partial [Chloroflexi bacterium]|nr:hypothetical protein [Chloroflexota bacterium]
MRERSIVDLTGTLNEARLAQALTIAWMIVEAVVAVAAGVAATPLLSPHSDSTASSSCGVGGW